MASYALRIKSNIFALPTEAQQDLEPVCLSIMFRYTGLLLSVPRTHQSFSIAQVLHLQSIKLRGLRWAGAAGDISKQTQISTIGIRRHKAEELETNGISMHSTYEIIDNSSFH